MASRPPTPPSRDPDACDEKACRFKLHGTPCEWGESYRPGGYHPVVLGDVFQDRYRVIRKLGYGSFSTAWLAVDLRTNSFAALKVAVASKDSAEAIDKTVVLYRSLPPSTSRHVVGLRDSFEVLGPNGRHTCLVMDPAGAPLSSVLQHRADTALTTAHWDNRHIHQRLPPALARRVLRDTLLGLQVLHRRGIVHADLHPGNILAAIPPLGAPLGGDDAATPSALERALRQRPSDGDRLTRRDGKRDRWAPAYLLPPAPLGEELDGGLEPVVRLADLGAAFAEREPPAKTVTPVALRAPEAVLRSDDTGVPLGRGLDVWAFGCLAFEVLTGQPLFRWLEGLEGEERADEATNDEHLIQMCEVLGPLPEGFAARWRRRGRYYDGEGKRVEELIMRGGGGGGGDGESDEDVEIEDYDDHDDEDGGDEGRDMDQDMPGSPLSDTARSVDSNFWLARVGEVSPLEEQLRELKPDGMDEAEIEELARLLRWILEYEPSKRPSVESILGHPWFSS